MRVSASASRWDGLTAATSDSVDARAPRLGGSGALIASAVLDQVEEFAYEAQRDTRRFERRLNHHWKSAFDLYRLFYNCCLELGEQVAEWRATKLEAGEHDTWRLAALLMTHARACTITSEIHALLRTGHSNGAMARWRTLHELAVVAFLLKDGDEDLAERYVEHITIGDSKDATVFQKHATALGHDPLSLADEQQIAAERARLTAKFGPGYTSSWGWALPPSPGRTDLKFSELAERAGLAHHGPYVNLANHFNHGGSKGSYLDRIEFPDGEVIALGGATNTGLAEPASAAVIALNHVTIALLQHPEELTMRVLLSMHALQVMVQKVCDVFELAESDLDDVSLEEHP